LGWLKKASTLFFVALIFFPIKHISNFLYKYGGKLIILKVYKVYSIIKKYFKSDFIKNKFLHLFGSRYIVHLVIIMIATLVATSNIYAREKTDLLLKFEDKSIASKLIKAGEFNDFGEEEELIREVVDIEKIGLQKRNNYYTEERKNSLAYQPRLDIPEDLEEGLGRDREGLSSGLSLIKTDESPQKRTETDYYTVVAGDTVYSIAKRFNVTANTIIWENDLNKYGFIKLGQELTVLPTTGITYKVKKYDTIGKIANKYDVEEDEIMKLNKIASATSLQIGKDLIIPGGRKVAAPVPAKTTTQVARYEPTEQKTTVAIANIKSSTDLMWPASCNTISQYYHWRHHGLDIACKKGTPIYAAEDGVIEKTGWSTGYGKRVTIKHGTGLTTLYAHLTKIYVQPGEAVNRGDVIGAMGSTGWSTGSHLHFEVRVGNSKKNPLNYIK
jgi:murein DD-endopeptidase MepM/ murein hydrolase activator NlpD